MAIPIGQSYSSLLERKFWLFLRLFFADVNLQEFIQDHADIRELLAQVQSNPDVLSTFFERIASENPQLLQVGFVGVHVYCSSKENYSSRTRWFMLFQNFLLNRIISLSLPKS